MTATGFGPYARPLDAISLADTDQVGRKAAVLGELTAAARDRWDFLLTAAPLPIRGGTGSPANPIATF